jgi:hypothetical protein
VSPKTLALVAAAVAVMGMGLYLFIQVKSTPAQAHAPTPSSPATTTARPSPVQGRSTESQPSEDIAPPSRPPSTEQGGNAQIAAAARAVNDRVAAEAPPVDQRANPKADEMMALANKHYDAQDFDQAIAAATKVLANDPTNVRMLRIMVSANCIGGDSALAQQYYEKLPAFDRGQMKSRCERYGVFFTDPSR